jgi:polysaccharide export outer membrane protein
MYRSRKQKLGKHMSKYSIGNPLMKHAGVQQPAHQRMTVTTAVLLWVGFLLLVNGCQTASSQTSSKSATSAATFSEPPAMQAPAATNSDSIVLREGDTVRVTFPGAETLNRVVLIRRDGRVTLPQIGEFKAAGLTPREMEKQLLDLFGPYLQTKEVSVAVESSSFPVYVTGSVLRPGKILSDRPLTALEAIMEAGGFDYTKANLKAVRVLRMHQRQTEHFTLNLKRVLQGQQVEQFPLKPLDIIYVPERFSFF